MSFFMRTRSERFGRGELTVRAIPRVPRSPIPFGPLLAAALDQAWHVTLASPARRRSPLTARHGAGVLHAVLAASHDLPVAANIVAPEVFLAEVRGRYRFGSALGNRADI